MMNRVTCYSETRETSSATEEPVPGGLAEVGPGEQTGQAAAASRGGQIERRRQKRQGVFEVRLEAGGRDYLGLDLRESG